MGSATSTPTFQAVIGNIKNADGSTPIYSAGAYTFKNASAVTTLAVSDAGVLSGPATGLRIQGGNGTAVPAGMVGYVINFTERGVTASTSNYAASTSIGQLTTGVWEIYCYWVSNTGTATKVDMRLATNNSNDGTGLLGAFVYMIPSATVTLGGAMTPVVINVTGATQDIYGKALSATATHSMTVGGYAVRRA
jgi:hypothetical protein